MESRDRRAKLERLRDAGVEPFPHSFADRTEIASVRERHEGLEAGAETDDRVRIAGRLTARRGMGKASFLDLRDGTGQIQVQARLDDLGDTYEGLLNMDLGDIVGIDGVVFMSKRGELSVRAEKWELLSKSLRPPPDKFHGLEDVETRYRKRELDLMANEETRELFLKRAKTIAAVRRWFDDRGFVEVETPVLQPLYGGALARPFTTHHNALDRDLYLRIATELYLKRCIVGGIDKVYELGKDFRNEGVSHKHNPEFTMLEWYEAYADYEDIAAELETLVSEVAQQVLGTTMVEREGEQIDLAPPWRRVTLGRRSRRRPGSTCSSTATATRWPRRWAATWIRRRVGQAGRRPAVEERRAEADRSRPSSRTTPSSSRPSPSATGPRRAWSSAGRRSSAGWRSRTPSPS